MNKALNIRMRKYWIILGVTVLLIAASVAFSLTRFHNVKAQGGAVQTTAVRYIVRDYNGLIGVFEEGDSNPKKVLNVRVSGLPQSDQRRLENGGIVVAGED